MKSKREGKKKDQTQESVVHSNKDKFKKKDSKKVIEKN